jgi:hypothetical protein
VRPGRGPVVATKDEDKVEKVGEDRITFPARTGDDIDGFDFRVGQAISDRETFRSWCGCRRRGVKR